MYTLVNKKEVDNKKSYFKVKKAYEKCIDEIKPDLIIDVFAAMSVYTNNIKKKYNIPNITWEHYNYYNNLGFNKYWRALAIKKSDKIIVLTKTDMEHYITNKPIVKSKIDYIFNPSPFEVMDVDKTKKQNIVLAVGRLTKLKGFNHLLDVWKIVETKNDSWKLLIVGNGEEKNSLEEKIKNLSLKRAYLEGETNDLSKYYEMARILVSTSDTEGLPMVMIEAQSYGVPIVSYNYETGPKDIISEEIDGFIVYDKNQDIKNKMMANKILELINDKDLQNRMGCMASKNSKRFNMDTIIKKWRLVINELINKKGIKA